MLLIFAQSVSPYAGILIIAGAVLLAVTVLMSRFRQKGRTGNRNSRLISGEIDSVLMLKESMDKMFVELQEFSRTAIAKLDVKIRIVEQLLRDADTSMEKLRELQADVEELCKRADAMNERGSVDVTQIDDEHGKVIQLVSEGVPVSEISRITGMPRGEIELVLSLSKRKGGQMR